MKQFTKSKVDDRIASFMERKMQIFPELRHQPEMKIKETSERRSVSQWFSDKLAIGQSVQQ